MKLKKEQEEEQRKLGAKYRCRFNILDLRKRKQVEIMVDDFINRKKDGYYMVPGSQRYAVIIARRDLDLYYRYHNLRHPYVKATTKNSNTKTFNVAHHEVFCAILIKASSEVQ